MNAESPAPNPVLEAALAYVVAAWSVFPVNGKVPLTPHGVKDATTDPNRIRDWWRRWPEAGVAVATGEPCGFVILDVDPRHGGALEQLENGHGPLPPTPIAYTGGGGFHVLFAMPDFPVGNKVGLMPGIDLRGTGGYAVLAPSPHESGRRYAWAPGCSPKDVRPAPLPAWLADLLRPKRRSPRPPARVANVASANRYGLAALEAECAAVAAEREGERNHRLNMAAFSLGQLVGGGVLERGAVELALADAAESCGLPAGEAERTIGSGLEAGMLEPRGVPESNGAPAGASPERLAGPVASRRRIRVRNELSAVVEEAEAALLGYPDAGVYVRARMLVRVTFDRGALRYGLRRAVGSPVVEPLSLDALRKRIDRVADWFRWDPRRKAEVPALPPEWVGRSILASDSWDFPILAGVVESPTLRPDGSLLDRPGYDLASGLLYVPAGEFPRIPENPTSADMVAAYRLLHEPLADFPFVAREDRAAAVSAILSLVARAAIGGPVPLFAIRATTPGTGKGLLADAMAIIGTGRPAARTALPPDDAELRKAILAIALEGLPVVLLDNIDRSLGSSTLAAALTARSWRDRLLGLSKTAEAPLSAVWQATGNGLVFRGDLGRRVVPIDLDANLEHPEDRGGFRYPDLLVWVHQRRPELVAAALTILRGYVAAGRPPHGAGPRKGSFEAWDDLVRGACIWAEFGDPVRGCERIRREDDSDLEALRGALRAWREAFGDSPTTAAGAVSVALRRADPKGTNDPALRDSLLGLTPTRDRLEARPLGYGLRRVRGRIVDGLRFVDRGRVDGSTAWSVASSDGTSGDTGHVS